MSSTNYDVELNISYNNSYRHYIPTYTVKAPYFYHNYYSYFPEQYNWNYFVSLDDGSETELGYCSNSSTSTWAEDNQVGYSDPETYKFTQSNIYIPDSGVFSKIYFRNPWRNRVTFTTSNCAVK